MDQTEARSILSDHLAVLRGRRYDELRALLDEPEVSEVTGPSGALYQVELQAMWDNRRSGSILVIASIDDGGWPAFAPMSESFIVAPDGSSVGD